MTEGHHVYYGGAPRISRRGTSYFTEETSYFTEENLYFTKGYLVFYGGAHRILRSITSYFTEETWPLYHTIAPKSFGTMSKKLENTALFAYFAMIGKQLEFRKIMGQRGT